MKVNLSPENNYAFNELQLVNYQQLKPLWAENADMIFPFLPYSVRTYAADGMFDNRTQVHTISNRVEIKQLVSYGAPSSGAHQLCLRETSSSPRMVFFLHFST